MGAEEAIATLEALHTLAARSVKSPDYAAIAEILFPADDLKWAINYIRTLPSLCAVASKAGLRRGGCKCREHGAYEPRAGMAVSDIEAIARRHGAWITDSQGVATYPARGDVYTMDVHPNWHVGTVTGSDAASGSVLFLDSGQPAFRTEPRERLLFATDVGAFLQDRDDGVSTRPGYRRPVYGRLDSRVFYSSLHRCRLPPTERHSPCPPFSD